MARYVIKVGGSVLAPDGPDVDLARRLADALKEIAKDAEVYVVVGGGHVARQYIDGARSLGAPDAYCDIIAIDVTRANARFVIAALGDVAQRSPPTSIEGAAAAAMNGRVVVMGGTVPGHTTDAVAALLAEYVGADALVLCKDVGGVYTADPKKNPEAAFIPSLTGERLLEIVSKGDMVAGVSAVTDLLAAQVISRSGLCTYVVDGRDTVNIITTVRGKECPGSRIN
ncbi:MAG: UMP kinase [Candidatus Undinarchaeales archaeon]|jgi:uridylate kinase|nr:UMP kinase [Candidatus Undinarchaeales archaeon]MDP7493405.1 UMP kinase [Candidatus Undinarchaeales archaeon]